MLLLRRFYYCLLSLYYDATVMRMMNASFFIWSLILRLRTGRGWVCVCACVRACVRYDVALLCLVPAIFMPVVTERESRNWQRWPHGVAPVANWPHSSSWSCRSLVGPWPNDRQTRPLCHDSVVNCNNDISLEPSRSFTIWWYTGV